MSLFLIGYAAGFLTMVLLLSVMMLLIRREVARD